MNNKSWKREKRSIIINDDLTIDIRYEGTPNLGKKAIPLDNEVLPLIAAAPDLLEAAQLAVGQLESYADYYNDTKSKIAVTKLKKAIAKAAPTYDN